jgi:nucleoid DNA-binding protein
LKQGNPIGDNLMDDSNLHDAVAAQLGVNKEEAAKISNIVLNGIRDLLVAQNSAIGGAGISSIRLKGFGKFQTKIKHGGAVIDPRTGERTPSQPVWNLDFRCEFQNSFLPGPRV